MSLRWCARCRAEDRGTGQADHVAGQAPPAVRSSTSIPGATRSKSSWRRFAGLASEGALVLPASGELPVGTEGRFAIRLRDQTVAMRGRCRVTGARPAPGVPAGGGPRPTLLRVLLLEMEEESASMHRRLLARRRAAVPVPIPPAPSESTVVSPPRPEVTRAAAVSRASSAAGLRTRRDDDRHDPARASRAPARRHGRPPVPFVDTRPSPPAETRTPGAAFTLPANPLSELDATDLASFIDSTLLESDDEDATAEREAGPAHGDDETLGTAGSPRARRRSRSRRRRPRRSTRARASPEPRRRGNRRTERASGQNAFGRSPGAQRRTCFARLSAWGSVAW